MKILLLGKNGQVGFELQRSLQTVGQVLALDRNTDKNGYCGDITDFDKISNTIEQYEPNIIVNAAAYTAVDKAENEQSAADLVNHWAVQHLIDCAKKYNSLIVHYSTDYVFDGTGNTAWKENHFTHPCLFDDESINNHSRSTPHPINYYGISKRKGEIALENSTVRFINIRTSWVFGVYGNNFLKTMLKLGKEKQTLNIIHDQVGSPTPAFLIADITAKILNKYKHSASFDKNNLVGHYHLAPDGYCSWYEYADFIFQTAQKLNYTLAVQNIYPITTEQYPTAAKRPLNSRLDTQKIKYTLDITLPHWQFGVQHVMQILTQNYYLGK